MNNLPDTLRERYKPKQEFRGVWLTTHVEFLEDENSWTLGSFEKFGYDEQGIWFQLNNERSYSTELCIDWTSIRSITEDPNSQHAFVIHLEIAFLISVIPKVLPVQLLKECYRRGKLIRFEKFGDFTSESSNLLPQLPNHLRPMVFTRKGRTLALICCWLITAFGFSHLFETDTSRLAQLEKEGVFAAATVHESAPIPTKNNATYFTCSYKIDGKDYKSVIDNKSYRDGQEIQVRYLPSSPDICTIAITENQ